MVVVACTRAPAVRPSDVASAFRLELAGPDEAQMQHVDVDAEGGVTTWYAPEPRPTAPPVVRLRPDGTWLEIEGQRVIQTVRASDGRIVRPDVDHVMGTQMICTLRADQLRCRCEGHTPVIDVVVRIHGDQVLSSLAEAPHTTVVAGRVTPGPRTTAARARVLTILASHLLGWDNHDGDRAAKVPRH